MRITRKITVIGAAMTMAGGALTATALLGPTASAASPTCAVTPRVTDAPDGSTDSTIAVPIGRILVDQLSDKVTVESLDTPLVAGGCARNKYRLVRWLVVDAAGMARGEVTFDGVSDTAPGDLAKRTFTVDRTDTLGNWHLIPRGARRMQGHYSLQSGATIPAALRSKADLSLTRSGNTVFAQTRVTKYSQISGNVYSNAPSRVVRLYQQNTSGFWVLVAGPTTTNVNGRVTQIITSADIRRYRVVVDDKLGAPGKPAWSVTSASSSK